MTSKKYDELLLLYNNKNDEEEYIYIIFPCFPLNNMNKYY